MLKVFHIRKSQTYFRMIHYQKYFIFSPSCEWVFLHHVTIKKYVLDKTDRLSEEEIKEKEEVKERNSFNVIFLHSLIYFLNMNTSDRSFYLNMYLKKSL